MFADLDLARRLERVEGLANAAFVESRARLRPEVGACWVEHGGALAMFDGVGSPMTQTFGFGVSAPPTAALLHTLEAFFFERGADAVHEVSPFVDPAHLGVLHAAGYAPIELTTQLVRPTSEPVPDAPHPAIVVGPADRERWADASAAGWVTLFPGAEAFCRDLAHTAAQAPGSTAFAIERDGLLWGTASARGGDGVALLSGAATVPAFRRRGVQRSLLAARLAWAREQGHELCTMGAAPGGESQRNAQRAGFRIVGTRIQWRKQRPSVG